MTRELQRVEIELVPRTVSDETESHTPREVVEQYEPWVVRSTDRFLTFRGATFAAQLDRDPIPRVRVVLAYNPDPQPLVAGGWLLECRPTPNDWLPEQLERTDVDRLYGLRVSYRTPGATPDPVEYARSMVEADVRGNFRYQIEETTVEDGHTTLEVWIPERDTGNHSRPQRLFPTAVMYESLGRKDV